MNPSTLVMLIQPLATPFVTALLSDPRPGRVWIKVGVAFVMTILATAIQLQGVELSLTLAVETFLKTLLYNQGVHRLFKHSFDNLENATGNGMGIVADALGKSLQRPPSDPWGAPSVPGRYPEN